MAFNAFDAGCLCSDKVSLARMKTQPPILGLIYYPFAFLNVSDLSVGHFQKTRVLARWSYRPTKKIKFESRTVENNLFLETRYLLLFNQRGWDCFFSQEWKTENQKIQFCGNIQLYHQGIICPALKGKYLIFSVGKYFLARSPRRR